jgi:hypothetical protein
MFQVQQISMECVCDHKITINVTEPIQFTGKYITGCRAAGRKIVPTIVQQAVQNLDDHNNDIPYNTETDTEVNALEAKGT